MTSQHFGQLAATFVAVLTPLLVVGVARLVARRHAALVKEPIATPGRALRMLVWATAVIGVPALALVWSFQPLSLWPAVIDLTAFAGLAVFGLRALSELDAASRSSRTVSSSSREASLAPRRLGDYIPLPLRSVPFVVTAIGVAAFGVRAALPAGPRQLFVPITFAGAAVLFLWLYEVWMRDLVAGPVMAGSDLDDQTRRRTIRRVLTMETILTATCIAEANLLLNLDWTTRGGIGTAALFAGAVVAIIGCAFALASGLGRRVYASASR